MTIIRNRDELEKTVEREVALDSIESGIGAVMPDQVIQRHVSLDDNTLDVRGTRIDLSGFERIFVVGGGKGSSLFAREIENLLQDRIKGGVIVDSRPRKLQRLEVVEGGHPVPDEGSVEGASKVLRYARDAGEKDLVLVVITGGGSSLMASPAGQIRLKDLRKVNSELLKSGASIHEINAVRKHVSGIKGGKLAREALPASVVSLVVSDVVGDDLSVIASGPTSPDESTFQDALNVVSDYGLDVPKPVMRHLRKGEDKKDNFENVTNLILANNFDALEGARRGVRREHPGYSTLILSSYIEGESSEIGKLHGSIAKEIIRTGNPVEPPCVVISGGETTVTVDGGGKGGPNGEFVLSCLSSLPEGATFAAVDTDGIDGVSEAAGAIGDGLTSEKARRKDIDIGRCLSNNDSYGFFNSVDGLILMDETGTNVSDLRAVVIS
ncbi:MAG: DUF4147 domain-containing protein [Halobacteria archaeon]|nr:DUF4147 domain-containing protein [Halobacteria archaeon]